MITPITFGIKNNYPNNNKTQTQRKSEIKKEEIPPKIKSPSAEALYTTAAWFGFGFALDRVMAYGIKYLKTSPIKTSFILNSIIAAGAGIYTYITEKIRSKKASA